MNKTKFRLLVFFMSLSLIGIILVQLYWVNSSLKNNDEQFKFHIQRILGKVSGKLQEQEMYEFVEIINKYKDSTGKTPLKADLISYYKNNGHKADANDSAIYHNDAEDYDHAVIERDIADPMHIEDLMGKSPETISGTAVDSTTQTSIRRRDREKVELVERIQFERMFRDYREMRPIEERISEERLEKILSAELEQSGVSTPFEFAVYNNGIATNIRSDNFKYDPSTTNQTSFFADNQGLSRFRLLVSFPQKKAYLFTSLIGISSLSLVFTLIIIIAYLSAISQLVKQKQISEIKTDFINNMTHEFKTPIATINLALDAIKNPKVFDDKERVQRYLQMIKDENKRMHSQVENVLQISKLDKKELDIDKSQADIHTIIDGAIEHVKLIIEERNGTLTKHFEARRTTTLLNDVHFTNVLVNVLDNAIKYSPDEPVIDVYTENVKDFIIIKIQDKGLGMSKVTQKRIFEKFYREHTGDVHNVKGHGLGLAYVKRIVDDHNCQIYVESEKGKGSTFIIKMPLIN